MPSETCTPAAVRVSISTVAPAVGESRTPIQVRSARAAAVGAARATAVWLALDQATGVAWLSVQLPSMKATAMAPPAQPEKK